MGRLRMAQGGLRIALGCADSVTIVLSQNPVRNARRGVKHAPVHTGTVEKNVMVRMKPHSRRAQGYVQSLGKEARGAVHGLTDM